jgi:hypothetical protein
MSVPTTAFAIVGLVITFVPGFVFAVVRIWQRGFRADDRGLDSRIAQSLVVSVIFDSVYLVAAFWWLPPEIGVFASQIEVLNPVALGVTVFVGAITLPALVAWTIYTPLRISWRRPPRWFEETKRAIKELGSKSPFNIRRRWWFSSVPTAWGLSPA